MKKIIEKLAVSIFLVMVGINVVSAQTAAGILEIGDYVSMTPTKTSYTIPADKTGCTSASYCDGHTNQTINPSKLNVWRVIDFDGDEIILVSDQVSSESIYFYGKTGYLNYVGVLNDIAAAYTNDNYTIGSRHVGYYGTYEYITDPEILAKITYPLARNSDDISSSEYGELSGSDNDYDDDVHLLENVGLLYNDIEYYLASRSFDYNNDNSYGWGYRYVNESGVSYDSIYGYWGNGLSSNSSKYSVRPIVIIKNDIEVYGEGTKENPYTLAINDEQNPTEDSKDEAKDEITKEGEIDNPQTGSYDPYIVIFTGIVLAVGVYFYTRNRNKVFKI